MIFQAVALHDPQKIALKDETRAISYGALLPEIERRAAMLSHVQVLGLAGDNSLEWILWDLAALHAGVVCVPLPPFFTPEQTSHALTSAGVTHIVTGETLTPTGIAPVVLPAGTAKITFTSGTTGTPKGVCLSQQSMEDVASSLTLSLQPLFDGTHACVLPLAVLLENVAGVYASLLSGHCVHMTPLARFGQAHAHLHECLQHAQAASVILVPELLKILMRQVSTQGALPYLKFAAVGGARVEASLIGGARTLGLPVYEGYGLSECASVVSLNLPGVDKAGTAGRLLPHVKARVEDGEIIIQNPGFLGYTGLPLSGPYATGDLGAIDADGFVTIAGRKKNILITSYGRNVSPEWVEAVLLAQPGIAQACVYGDGDPYLSALIVPFGPEADLSSAVAVANAKLPGYARVGDWHAVTPFTQSNGLLTGNGRIRRDAVLKHHLPTLSKEINHEFL